MLKRLLIAIGLLIITGGAAFGQAGTLRGTVTDKETKETIPDATVQVMLDGKMIKGTITEDNGEYAISNLEIAREYDLVVSFVGYSTVTQKIRIAANSVTVMNVALPSTALTKGPVVVTADEPLIKQGDPVTGTTYGKEEMAYIPTNNVAGVAAMTAGIGYEDGGQGSARGEGGMVTYVNGIRKSGANIPKQAIGELQYILGGTPAKYGEAMGGVQNITLLPPASTFTGNVSFQTTEPFDTWGYERLDVFLTGPLLKKKVEQGNYERTVIGYRLTAYGTYARDNMYRPHDDAYRMLRDDVLSAYEQEPLYFDPTRPGVVYNKADFFRADDFHRQINKPNLWSTAAYIEGGIDFRFSETAVLRLNGEFTYSQGMQSGGVEMNNAYNGVSTGISYNINGSFEQRFPNMDTSSIIKNLTYTLSASFSNAFSESQSDKHRDRYFDYGYVGKFETQKIPTYTMQRYTIDGVEVDALVQNGFADTAVWFTPSDLNPARANYTRQLFANELLRPALINRTSIQQFKGLTNGDSPSGGYGMFTLPGTQPGYQKAESQARFFQGTVSGSIGSHALELGFQYDQTINRSYSLSASNLWTLMKQLANVHILDMDIDNPIIDNSGMYPIIGYDRKYVASAQTYFDKSLRQKLGLAVDGTDWLDVDSYAPNTFAMDMFSPDDLFNSGNPYVTYKGYDHTGKKITGKTSLQDFFNNSSRTLGAYSPIYMAGYIQDQFYVRDLIFNIGIRVDRFDGNQMVLKDPYLLYDSYTAGEVSGTQNPSGNHPAGVGKDWVVYVDDFRKGADARITGYRSGNTWYNASGVEISNPQDIAGELARPTPYRKDPTLVPDEVSVSAFKDYDPEYVFMPRIAFSFPVSDESQFKASYDIVANRPSGGWEADYRAYMFMPLQTTISNPNLKPQRVTNYEISFEQALGQNSVVKIGAYYKEIRDLIALVQYTGADPNPNYYSYDNLDFKTTKGFVLEYELRRVKNFRLSANYTYQYVDETALPAETMQSLIRAGYSNLKMLHDAGVDRRNTFKMTPIIMFASKDRYNGPTTRRIVKDANGEDRVKTIKWLENFSMSIPIIAQSGTPYTKRFSNTQPTIVGSYNGVRLPWQFFVNAQISKGWEIKAGKRNTMLMAQLRIDNVFNIRNIRGVYAVTGDPDDNGYLTDPDTQNTINSYTDPQSYRDMYTINLQKGSYSNYTSPRMIYLTLSYSF